MGTPMAAPHPDRIAWIDLETTGLDSASGHLLEVGVIVTDNRLREVALPFESILVPAVSGWAETMDEYVRQMHTTSGLIEDINSCQAPEQYRLAEVDALAAAYLSALAEGQPVILGGNSITFDRQWMQTHMPRLFSCLHYRSLDMTSVSQFAERVLGAHVWPEGKDDSRHRSIDDLRDSIRSAKTLRRVLAQAPARV